MSNQFSDFERLITESSSPGIRPGLERVGSLLELIGNPQDKFPAIHIVGTNGKGSTAAFLNSILIKSGYRTALYISPHLISPDERLLITDKTLPESEWLECAARVTGAMKDSGLADDPPSYFEILTAVAFKLAAESEVDIAVIEAGLGGRLDATNTLGDVAVSVVASISTDHTEYLGDTIEEIAEEKFAVVRAPETAVYLGDNAALSGRFPGKNVVMRDAVIGPAVMSLNGSRYDLAWGGHRFAGLEIGLIGEYQIYNSALAVIAALLASPRFPRINESSIRAGLISASWMGRMELVPFGSGKYALMDGGHNEDGVAKLVQSVKKLFGSFRNVAVVYAAMKDKDLPGCLAHLNELGASLWLTEVPGNARSAPVGELKAVADGFSWKSVSCVSDPADAFDAAMAGNDLVIVCGSLYFIGHIRDKIMRKSSRHELSPLSGGIIREGVVRE